MKKTGMKVISALIIIIAAAIYYYVTLPAINIHSVEFWYFVMILILALGVYYAGKKKMNIVEAKESKIVKGFV